MTTGEPYQSRGGSFMRRHFAVLILLLALPFSNAHAFARSLRIMPYGDSLTAGAYIQDGVFKTDAGYRFALWKLLTEGGDRVFMEGSLQDGPADFSQRHHEGHSGWRIDQIAAQEHQWVLAAQPDVVLLLIGTNDCIQNYDMPNAVNRLSSLVEGIEADAPHAHVFVSTPIPHSIPDVNNRIIAYNSDLTSWVAFKSKVDPKIHFVDMYTEAHIRNGIVNGVLGAGPTDLIDGVHPTPDGYIAMANVWYQALVSALRR
jgi:lysophospholipase L1-like esterase